MTVSPDVVSTYPAWFQELHRDFQAGVANAFILHGDVFDYAEHPQADLPIRDFLAVVLRGLFTVSTYSPDEGITFPGPSSVSKSAEARFRAATGTGAPDVPPPSAAQSTAQALLARAGRSTAGAAGDDPLPTAPGEALPLLATFLARATSSGDPEPGSARTEDQKRAAVLVERLDLIAPPADKGTMPEPARATLALLHRVGTAQTVARSRGLLILLAPSLEEVHPDLRAASSGIRAIEIPPPDVEQRQAYVERVAAKRKLTLEMPARELAVQLAGLSRRHIEDIALRALADRARPGYVTRALVRDRKREQIATEYAEVLTLLEPTVTLEDIGGQQLVKAFLQRRVIGPALSGDARKRSRIPQGIAFAGPPGTGKTYLASATAHAIGWNCVELDASKLLGQYVGESQKRLAKAIVGIRAMAPCLVFIDEMEQMLPRRVLGGSSGGDAVQSNMFGRLLQFFGDPSNAGRILPIGATNRPDQVDAAMFRPGRFDVKIPILPPSSDEERADILRTLLRRETSDLASLESTLLELGRSTENWTPAELKRLVGEAMILADLDELPVADALREARRYIQASTREIEYQTRLALAACDDLRLVPERWRPFVGQPAPTAIEQLDDEPDELALAAQGRTGDGLAF
jgi:transitional endoplasmic reticulum ATPase